MKSFVIQFFYNADLRAEVEVQALNLVQAFALACAGDGDKWSWCEHGKQFYIKIKTI